MTELEWQTTTDPKPMLEFLKGKVSDRKLRLLGVAIARASWDRLEDERSRQAIVETERFADGLIDAEDLEAVVEGAWDVRDELFDAGPSFHDDRLWLAEAAGITASVREWNNTFYRRGPSDDDYIFRLPTIFHCHLMWDIFGNPFRSIAVDLSWLTETAVAIANGIYDDKAFDRLPVLADALQDAGCENEDILNHLRSDGPHLRGCWALDLVLGKS